MRLVVACCAKASEECLSSPTAFISRRLDTQSDVLLAVRCHVATLEDINNILRMLLQLSAYHIEVLPLEVRQLLYAPRPETSSISYISRHAGAALIYQPRRVIPHSCALQYRLGEYRATYFERGTGYSILQGESHRHNVSILVEPFHG